LSQHVLANEISAYWVELGIKITKEVAYEIVGAIRAGADNEDSGSDSINDKLTVRLDTSSWHL
jgi:hypothetical protein